jgi:WD40 repeat protein
MPLAVMLATGVVELRAATTGAVLASLNPGRFGVPGDGSQIAFSPDGTTLAVAVGTEAGGEVDLLDVPSGRVTATFPMPNQTVSSVAFSPGGQTLAVGDGRSLVLIDLSTRASVNVPDQGNALLGGTMSVSFSASGVHEQHHRLSRHGVVGSGDRKV